MSDDEARQRLHQRTGVRVESFPIDVVRYFLDKLVDADLAQKNAGEHRSFIRSQGVYDSDYFDAGYDYDGRLEDVGDLENAVAAYPKRGLGRFQEDFDRWLTERKKI